MKVLGITILLLVVVHPTLVPSVEAAASNNNDEQDDNHHHHDQQQSSDVVAATNGTAMSKGNLRASTSRNMYAGQTYTGWETVTDDKFSEGQGNYTCNVAPNPDDTDATLISGTNNYIGNGAFRIRDGSGNADYSSFFLKEDLDLENMIISLSPSITHVRT